MSETKMCSRCKVEHPTARFAIDPHTKKPKPACRQSNTKEGRKAGNGREDKGRAGE